MILDWCLEYGNIENQKIIQSYVGRFGNKIASNMDFIIMWFDACNFSNWASIFQKIGPGTKNNL